MITVGREPNQTELPNLLLNTYSHEELMQQNRQAIGQVSQALASHEYALPITQSENPTEWGIWQRRAERAGNTIPPEANLGRVIVAEHQPFDTLTVLSHLALLGESAGAMPRIDGHQTGLATVHIRPTERHSAYRLLDEERPYRSPLDIYYDIYSDGQVTIQYGQVNPPESTEYHDYAVDLWHELRLDQLTDFPEEAMTISNEPVGPEQVRSLGGYVMAYAVIPD